MSRSGSHKAARVVGWSVAILLLLLVLLPFALYIPAVQNVVKNYACEWASRKTGMDISIGRILVKFPLDVSVDDVLVLEQSGDTMLQAGNLTAGIAFKPLLHKQVNVDEARLTAARYNLTTADSAMHVGVRVDECMVQGIALDLDHNEVNIADGALKGGNVTLDYLPYKKEADNDTTSSAPWHVVAHHLTLDDVDYTMQMLPTIDKMTAHVSHAELSDGVVDTGIRTVNARYLAVDSAQVAYDYPDEVFAKQYNRAHPIPIDTIVNPADSIPWMVRADSVRLTNATARYALRDAKPGAAHSLDKNYIEVTGLNVAIDSLYNRGTDVTAHLKSLSATERSGLRVEQGSGDIVINDAGIDLSNVKLKTLLSDIALDAHVDRALLDNKPGGKVHLTTNSQIALQEVAKLVPELAPTLKDIPQTSPMTVKGTMTGNTDRVEMNNFTATIPHYATATVSGTIVNPADPKRMSGDIDLDANFENINFVKPTLLDKALQRQVNFPPMKVKGTAHLAGDNISADAVMTLATGKVVGKGSFNSRSMAYDVDATFDHFPVKAVLPLSPMSDLSGRVRARGQGFDFTSPGSNLNADVNLSGVNYNNALYRNLQARVNLNGGNLSGRLLSSNDNCDLNVDFDGIIDGDHYVVDAHGDIAALDVRALGLYDGECSGKGRFDAHADVDLRTKNYDATVTLSDIDWKLDGSRFVADEAIATFNATDSTTRATLDNEDNHLAFNSDVGFDRFISSMTAVGDIATEQYRHRALNIDTLRHTLPPFNFNVQLGRDGLVQRYLERYDVDFRDVNLMVRNDSNIYADGYAHGVTMSGTNIDTLTFHASEWKEYLAFKVHMGNRRGTMDEFAQVDIEGGAIGSTVDFLVTQRNINREMGYRVGCNATLTDTAIVARFFPEQPVIGYKQWSVNKDNYVNYNYHTRMIDADMTLRSDSSCVAIRTERAPGATHEDIFVDIHNLKLEEWTRFMPSMPSMSGMVDADIDLSFDGKNIEGTSVASLKNFVYDGRREGDFVLNTDYSIDPATASTRVNSYLMVDGAKVALAVGALNDSTATSPLNVNLSLERFPLSKVSAFIPGNMIRLRGYANGHMAISGSLDAPLLNGTVAGDSAYMTIPRYGASLQLPSTPLNVRNNTITFNNYQVMGLNNKPVNINGTVDMANLSSPVIDLRLQGRNVQFIGSEQRAFSEVFGKGFADVDATVRSRGNTMNINADVALLSGSNITYVMKDDLSSLASQVDEDMVTFVNLKDSVGGTPTLVTAAGGATMTNMVVGINVQQGAKIGAYLSEDGKDRATIDGSGQLRYALDFAGKENFTGTYTIESGNVRYSPPLISQKNFDITSGSSVVWTGEMLNPQLNITGTEHVKTSVNSSDTGSRVVDFIITANVGGTLRNINLGFDMATEGDMDIQNELQSMSDTQRSQAAINMLLYNTYSGTNSAGNVNNLTAGTALFSFLQSQLNAWAAKSLKGVDLSFGINQYESASTGSTATSYSYHLSKSLFSDRFKIVVGGEYTTDASAEENFGQNLISDISFEYYLNKAGTKYLRLFRHTGFESVLEGQVTETGAGFVMKRKVGHLGRLFRYKSAERIVQDSIEDAEKAREKAMNDSIKAAEQARKEALKQVAAEKSTKTRKDDDNLK